MPPRRRPLDSELVSLVASLARATGGATGDALAGADTGDVALRRLRDGYGPLMLAGFTAKVMGIDGSGLLLGSSSGVGAGLGAADERLAA